MMAIANLEVCELQMNETKEIDGGKIDLIWYAAGFLISPAFGFFNAGVLDGLQGN